MNHHKTLFCLLIGLITLLPTALVAQPAENPTFWENTIVAFEEADAESMPPEDAIVFVGSSSIVFWRTLAEDMAPLTTIRRGFGGSRLGDVNYYTDRIVLKYKPKAVVIFAGTNDIAGDTPKQPEEVLGLYQQFVAKIHAAQPDTPIYFIAITPTWARARHFDLVRETNRLVTDYSAGDDRLHFIDTASAMVDEKGEPKPEYFIQDKLHLNADGYAVWTSVVRPILMRDFGQK